MCSLCGKRYFTVTALKKHHATHGENGGGSAAGTSGGVGGGGNNLVTMDIESKIIAKTTSESAAEPSDDDANAIDASLLEMDGFAQVHLSLLPRHVGEEGEKMEWLVVEEPGLVPASLV